MNLETVILEKVRALPSSKQAKVLAFVEEVSLENINEQETSRQNGQFEPELDNSLEAKRMQRRNLIGMFRSEAGDISTRAEEILMAEIDKRSGWTMKK